MNGMLHASCALGAATDMMYAVVPLSLTIDGIQHLGFLHYINLVASPVLRPTFTAFFLKPTSPHTSGTVLHDRPLHFLQWPIKPRTPPEKMMADEKKGSFLEPVQSINEAELVEIEHNRNGQFHRSFTPRAVHVCSQTQSRPAR